MSAERVDARPAPGSRARRASPGVAPWSWRALAAVVLVLAVGAAAAVAATREPSEPTGEVSPPAPSGQAAPSGPPVSGRLSDGCTLDARGVPRCGALLGAAFGSNTDPTAWERTLGRPLGVRRTYYTPGKVRQAIGDARADTRAGRIPWISFKLPYSWADMADGRGDAWVSDLARKLATVDGPVWLAFHHEPENDGPIGDWTRMQQHLSPLVRRLAPNVAYTVILTGWNQVYGPPWLSLDAVWPRGTAIDLVGFDVYNDFGVERGGTVDDVATEMGPEYFSHFEAFSKRFDVPWAVAETGITDAYAARDQRWVQRTYQELLDHGGVALVYFNSLLNSDASWRLQGSKEQDFAAALRSSPTLELAPRQASSG